MILFDTHVLVWFVNGDDKLSRQLRERISFHQENGLAISAITVWETAMLTNRNRIQLNTSIEDWISTVLQLPYIELIPLSPEISIEAIHLPSPFHKDPADRIIVATSRILNIPVATIDRAINDYPHVKKI
jgi:PIN domain nuclease of toxin-antitoxin system